MISRLRGILLTLEGDRAELATPGGVVYEVKVPLSVAERLPSPGSEVELRTLQVVRDDAVILFGFLDAGERLLFQRLLSANRVGAGLALALLSTFSAARLARALAERDVAALVQVDGVGKKTAERILLELSDRVGDLNLAPAAAPGEDGPAPAQAAVQALIALGMSFTEADARVREALKDAPRSGTQELVRRALGAR